MQILCLNSAAFVNINRLLQVRIAIEFITVGGKFFTACGPGRDGSGCP